MRPGYLFYSAILATVVVCVPVKTHLEPRIENGLALTPPMGSVYYIPCVRYYKVSKKTNKSLSDGIRITTTAAAQTKPS